MFVFDEETFDVYYEAISNSKVIGFQIEQISGDVYVYVACSDTSHFILSFSADESYLDRTHFESVLRTVFNFEGVVCTFDAKRLYKFVKYNKYNNLKNYKFKNLDRLEIYDIRYISNLYKHKINCTLDLERSSKSMEPKGSILIDNLIPMFKSENEIYTFYKSIYCQIFQADYFALRKLFNASKFYIDQYNNKHLERCNTLSEIESNGIYLNCNSQFFRNCNSDQINYYEYNTFTNNGRLSSNPNNDVNILTIPNDSTRRDIVSKFKNGTLFYFDYVSLHPRLLLLLLKETNIENDVYNQFLELINESNILTRDEVKNVVYKLIYSKSVNLAIFKDQNLALRILEFSEELYSKWLHDKFVVTPYNKEIYLDRMSSAGVVLSNYLQSIESDFVLNKIKELINYIKTNDLKSQIVLYLYDGIVLDYNPEDDLKFIKDALNILQYGDNEVFSSNVTFPAKMMYGKNLYDMKNFVQTQN